MEDITHPQRQSTNSPTDSVELLTPTEIEAMAYQAAYWWVKKFPDTTREEFLSYAGEAFDEARETIADGF